MEPGITYRINLSPRKVRVDRRLPARDRSFGSGRRVVSRECGGYFTLTLGPGRGGTYSLLVSAPRGTEAVVGYHLQAAAAQPDDQGPGVPLSSDARVSGSLSGAGIDAVDLYRFDVGKLSTVRQPLASSAGIQLALTRLDGTRIANATLVDAANDPEEGHVPARSERCGSHRRQLHAGITRSRRHEDDADRRRESEGHRPRREPGRSTDRDDTNAWRRHRAAGARVPGSPRRLGLPPIVGREPGLERSVHASRHRRLACAATFFGTRASSPSASQLVYVDATTAG